MYVEREKGLERVVSVTKFLKRGRFARMAVKSVRGPLTYIL